MRIWICVWLSLVLSVWVSSIDVREYVRCAGEDMDKELCDDGSYIEIQRAFYKDDGWYGLSSSCSEAGYNSSACSSNITGDYLEEIRQKCNNRTACQGLVAGKKSTNECNTVTKSDYVLLEYRCIIRPTTPEVPVTTSDDRLSSVPDITDDPRVTPVTGPTVPMAQDSKNLGLLVGLPVVLVCLLVIVIVIVVIVIRRRQSSAKYGHPGSDVVYENNDYDTAATAHFVNNKEHPQGQSYIDMNFSQRDINRNPDSRNPKETQGRPQSENEYELAGGSTKQEPYVTMDTDEDLPEPTYYSEVMSPTSLQDVEGFYNVPRNSQKVVKPEVTSHARRADDSVFKLQKQDSTYENVSTDGIGQMKPPKSGFPHGSSDSVTSADLVVVDNALYA